ncbi:MAG TPA: proteasome subunit beta [Streptosporangiaceae bacterium]|jgi:proteasome beta subunit|nr:proteasome subunit beta [Streptosporangiaceae bacterium]
MATAYLSAGTSSFSEFLTSAAPELLPGAGGVSVPSGLARELPHGTTIVAAAFNGGVVMAGDRRATAGNMISQRDIEKVYRSDEYSCIGIAGVAGIGIDLVRLYQVELEHYEKLEGRALSLEGKANRLAGIVRANLGGAMQGLVVVPIFAGYDTDEGVGRIFSYDVAGGRYEEQRFYSIGSGSVFARGALKKLYADGMEASTAILACMQALYDAADDDAATGGPDPTRRIWPIVVTVTADGYQRLSENESGSYAEAVLNERLSAPDGPTSTLRAPNTES